MKRVLIPIILLGPLSPCVCAAEAGPAGRNPARADAAPDRVVGSIGRTRRIAFEGNRIFPTEELRKALAYDMAFVMACDPSAPLDAFLRAIAERLRLGYRNSGCPDAKVEVSYRPDNEGLPILVAIDEGPRYRQGKIVVRGGQGIDPERLIAALQGEVKKAGDAATVARLRKAMESEEARLPDPITVDVDPLTKWGESGEADWTPGEPVPFQEPGVDPLLLDVLYHLAEQGRPLAKCKTSHQRLPGGVADLLIEIADPGPEAVIGQIAIDGARTQSREDILKLVGLKNGQPVQPRDLDRAMLALWNSGRFFPFTIDTRRRGPDAREIDFHLRLCEIPDVPLLSEPVTPEQQAVFRFFSWLNRGMDGEDVLLEWDDWEDTGLKMAIGWSDKGGMLVDLQRMESKRGLVMTYSDAGFSVLIRDGERRMSARSAIRFGGLKTWLQLLPSSGEHTMQFSFGAGLSSLGADSTFLQNLEIVVTPAMVFLKPDKVRREGDAVLISDMVRIDLETGRLIEMAGGTVTIKPGCVGERRRLVDEEIASAPGSDATAMDWWEAMSAMVESDVLPGELGDMAKGLLASSRNAAGLLDLLGKAGAFEALGELVQRNKAGGRSDEFDIPSDFVSFAQGGTGALLASLGCLWAAEECFPDVDWVTTFSRELLFMIGGQTGRSDEVMRGLLADPSIGPVGSLICARCLEGIAPQMAQRFLGRAREQSHPEGFINDWRLLISSRSLFAGNLDELRRVVVAFTPEQQKTTAALLPAELGQWLDELLEMLRQGGDTPPSEASLRPHMDRLWNDYLGARVDDYLAGRLLPPADPKVVAATINGVPVPRFMVRLMRDQQRSSLWQMPLPEADDAVPWTRDPALAAAVRLSLIVEGIRHLGNYPAEDVVLNVLREGFPELADQDDAEWIRATGMERQQLGDWGMAVALGESVMTQFATEVGEPPNEQVLRDHFDAHQRLFRSKLSTEMIFITPAAATPREWIRCHRLAAAVAGLGDLGLPLKRVGELAESDDETGLRIFTQTDALADMFQVPILTVLEHLAPGQASASLQLRNGIAVVKLIASKEDQTVKFEDLRDTVQEHWTASQVRKRAEEWFRSREQGVEILVLDDPDPGVPEPRSPFVQLHADHPDSKLGRLGDCWEKLASGDKGATDAALAMLFGAPAGKADGSDSLAGVLISSDLDDLALICLQKAAAVDRDQADAMTRQMEGIHAKHGENGCGVFHKLKAMRAQVFGDGAGAPVREDGPAAP